MTNRYFPFFELISHSKERKIGKQNTAFHLLTVLPQNGESKQIKYWINRVCRDLPGDFLEYKYQAFIKDGQYKMELYILSKEYKELIVLGAYLQSKPRTLQEIKSFLKTKDFLVIHKNIIEKKLLNTKTDDITCIISEFYYHFTTSFPILKWPMQVTEGKFKGHGKSNRYYPEFSNDNSYIHTVNFTFPEYMLEVSHTDLKKLIETVDTVFYNYDIEKTVGDRDLENQRIIELLEQEGLEITKIMNDDE